jgi:hypothetical protein
VQQRTEKGLPANLRAWIRERCTRSGCIKWDARTTLKAHRETRDDGVTPSLPFSG